ncbi:MAG: 30S ribosomal protein S20 [Alphaproteobacteria bacterium]
MANTASAKKRARQSVRRTEVNRARKSRVRTFVKAAERAIESGDKAAAAAALKAAEPELKRGVRGRVLHANAAARKVSRLARRVKALGSTSS